MISTLFHQILILLFIVCASGSILPNAQDNKFNGRKGGLIDGSYIVIKREAAKWMEIKNFRLQQVEVTSSNSLSSLAREISISQLVNPERNLSKTKDFKRLINRHNSSNHYPKYRAASYNSYARLLIILNMHYTCCVKPD